MSTRKTPEEPSKSSSSKSRASSRKSTAKKTPTKAAAKKTTAKKAPSRKTTAKKAPAKKPAPQPAPEEPIADDVAAEQTEASPQDIAPEPTEADEEPMTEPSPEPQEAGTEKPQAAVDDAVTKTNMVEAPEPVGDSADSVVTMMADKMIAFHLGGQRYGVPLESVQEIQQIVAFSEIPAAGGSVVGMVNLRGSVIPAIDMRFLIGLAPEEYTLETPMIICRAHGQLVALIVDEVEDVLTMPAGCLHPPPAMHNLSSKMIGVCRMEADLVYLLEVESLVAPLDLTRG
jgi:purine-binding chemotaxis protein CheW